MKRTISSIKKELLNTFSNKWKETYDNHFNQINMFKKTISDQK